MPCYIPCQSQAAQQKPRRQKEGALLAVSVSPGGRRRRGWFLPGHGATARVFHVILSWCRYRRRRRRRVIVGRTVAGGAGFFERGFQRFGVQRRFLGSVRSDPTSKTCSSSGRSGIKEKRNGGNRLIDGKEEKGQCQRTGSAFFAVAVVDAFLATVVVVLQVGQVVTDHREHVGRGRSHILRSQ